MAGEDNRKWVLVFDGGPDEHRVFRDPETDAYAIADRSGATPSTTDDGPLFVVREDFVLSAGAGGALVVHVPVEKAGHGDGYACSVSPKVGRFLAGMLDVPIKIPAFGAGAFVDFAGGGGLDFSNPPV